jgi:streptolysin S family bacteriocin protoxin
MNQNITNELNFEEFNYSGAVVLFDDTALVEASLGACCCCSTSCCCTAASGSHEMEAIITSDN